MFMRRFAFPSVFLAFAVALVAADQVLWPEADLSRYIGTQEGVGQPLDKAIHGVVADDLQLRAQERAMAAATTVQDSGVALRKALDLLPRMNLSERRVQLLQEAAARYPGSLDPNLVYAARALATARARAPDHQGLAELLPWLREAALGKTVDAELGRELVAWAGIVGNAAFITEFAKEFCSRREVNAGQRRLLLEKAIAWFEAQQPESAARKELEALREALDTEVDRTTQIKALLKAVDARLHKNDVAGLASEVDQMLKAFPESASQVIPLLTRAATTAAAKKQWTDLERFWTLFQKFPGQTDPGVLQAIERAAHAGLRVVIPEKKDGVAGRIVESMARVLPAQSDLHSYLKGECWVRSGAQGECPKLLYRVVFRPDASVTIDGRLDEAIYEGLALMPGPFWASITKEETPHEAGPLRLEARMLYTTADLFLAVRVPEPHPDTMLMAIPAGDDVGCCSDDCIALFLGLARLPEACDQYVIAAGGSYHLFARTELGKAALEGLPFQAACQVERSGYAVEMRIPLGRLGWSGRAAGRLVYANVRRNRYLNAETAKEEGGAVGVRQSIHWPPIRGMDYGWPLLGFLQFE